MLAMHSHSCQDAELKLCMQVQVDDSMGQVVDGLTILGYTGGISN